LKEKSDNPDFIKVAAALHVESNDLMTEWRILRKLPGDLKSQNALLDFAQSSDKVAMFPTFSAACRRLLLLPIGTATVKRPFSTMNRIMNGKRCRLHPTHTCQLMQIAIEGPTIPDVQESMPTEHDALNALIESAFNI